MNVVLLGDSRKAGVKQTLDELLPWLEQRATVVGVDLDDELDLATVTADMVVVLGGDGSMLSAARRMAGNQMPLVGINLGRLGFLAEVTPSEMKDVLERILAGEYRISRRVMLECKLLTRSETPGYSLGINDLVVSRHTSARMSSIRLEVGGERVATYWGDGLIVATPGGSTAYSLSAGGPIVYPEMEAFIVTPVCAHALTLRPFVTPSSMELRLEVEHADKLTAAVDGRVNWELRTGDILAVRRAKETLSLLEPEDFNYYHTLGTKLHWGKTAREGC